MEAVEYVWETLDLEDETEVLSYISAIKGTDERMKKMVGLRKVLLEITLKNLESASQLEEDRRNCLNESILTLNANIERVRRDTLDVQNKELEDINRDIFQYDRSFNGLWFQLESVTKKLARCQVRTCYVATFLETNQIQFGFWDFFLRD